MAVFSGYQPTYEELKQEFGIETVEKWMRYQPTYEELKQYWDGEGDTIRPVTSLPMRN